MTKFVTARRKGVLGRIRVPERTLRYMPGWQVVPDGDAKPRGRRRSRATQTPQQRPTDPPGPVETPDLPAEDTTTTPEGDRQP